MADSDILYAGVLEHMPGGVLAIDMHGRVQAFNPAAEQMLGLSAECVRGRLFAELFFDDAAQDEVAQAVLDAIYEANNRHISDIPYRRGDRTIWLNLTASALWSHPSPNEARHKVGVVVVFIDITQRKAAEEALRRANDELERRVDERTRELAEANASLTIEIAERIRAQERLAYLADHDALTGLPNRRLFEHSLTAALTEGGDFALLYLDLDGFKGVNDTHGHGVGDWLLQIVSRRLEHCLRDGDMLARLGGDEFAIVLRAVRTAQEVQVVAEHIVQHLSEPYRLDSGIVLRIGVSVGAALRPMGGGTPRDLIQATDVAMYEAKRSGRGTWRMAPGGAAALSC